MDLWPHDRPAGGIKYSSPLWAEKYFCSILKKVNMAKQTCFLDKRITTMFLLLCFYVLARIIKIGLLREYELFMGVKDWSRLWSSLMNRYIIKFSYYVDSCWDKVDVHFKIIVELFNFNKCLEIHNPCWRCYQPATKINSGEKEDLPEARSSCYHISIKSD